jgi:Flp pilus assembly protein TadG
MMKQTIKSRRLLRLAREEHGGGLVEFFISAWLLLISVFGMLEFGMGMYAYHFVSSAAQQGARYAIVRGAHWTTACSTSAPPKFSMTYDCKAASADVSNYVKSLTSMGLSSGSVNASATWPGTTPDCASSCSACSSSTENPGCMVQVQVTYSFNFLPLSFLPRTALSLSSNAEKVIQE